MTRILLLSLCLAIAACGVKGSLKKPSQIKAEEVKKQAKTREQNGPL